jgi:serine/threonine protein kinase
MIGKSIHHYNIIEKLGEGGMGIVYKAKDTKLNRQVAIKVLPPHLLTSEEDRTRFNREAKAAAALHHPHIATVFEINEKDGKPFIVMEYVEGHTLDFHIKKGPFKIQDAISIAMQIAEGLKVAHVKDIVHRDIKSSNVLLGPDNQAKVLDFGLAKTSMSTKLTQMGSTIGTIAYMSPEQVKGEEVDHRTDLWSLGILIYEMISGRLPYKAEYDQAIIYSIQNEEPEPLTSLRTGVPMSLEWIVTKLMAKAADERYQNANDLIIDLQAIDLKASGMTRVSKTATVHQSSASDHKENPIISLGKSKKWPVIVITALFAFLMGFALWPFLESDPELLPTVHASISTPQGIKYNSSVGGHSAISSDGKMLVFAGLDSLSRTNLWIRSLNSNESRVLPGTEKARYPFWSQDSRSIGFFADGELKTINAAGGPVLTLAPTPFGRGGAWSKNGQIIFSPAVTDRNLYTVPAGGGSVRQLTEFDSTSIYVPRFPFFLPDGERYIYSLHQLEGEATCDIYLGSLKDSEHEKILDDAAHAVFSSGHLLFLRQGILMAQTFDPEELSLIGDPVSLQGNINSWLPRAKADFSASNNEILVYTSGVNDIPTNLIWINDDGSESSIGQMSNLRGRPVLSPDETRIVYSEGTVIWIYNLNTKSKTRLTFSTHSSYYPVWSADGGKIYYAADVDGNKAIIFSKRTDGSGEEELLTQAENARAVAYFPEDISADGRYLLLKVGVEIMGTGEFAYLDLHQSQRPLPLKKIDVTASQARFSPDSKWIVFNSGGYGAGAGDIFVQPFFGGTGKWQITASGGGNLSWLKDQIIYFSRAADRWESITVSFAAGTPKFSSPSPLIKSGYSQSRYIFGGTRDAKKFLGLRPANTGSTNVLSVIVNWTGLIDEK